MAGFFTYFVVMGQNGFLPQDLFLLRTIWDRQNALLGDSYGQEWVSYYVRLQDGMVHQEPLRWQFNETRYTFMIITL